MEIKKNSMKGAKFTVLSHNGKSRTGKLELRHGTVYTPELMAVGTRATVRGLSSDDLIEIGAQMIIANTYHLMLKPGEEIVSEMGGINKFMNLNLPIATDSGGFQAFSLGLGQEHAVGKMYFTGEAEVLKKRDGRESIVQINEKGAHFRSVYDNSRQFLSPIKSIQIQHQLDSDVILVLDECTSPLSDKEYTKKSMERSNRWAKICLDYHRSTDSDQAIAGIIQGGVYKDLREEATKYICSLDFDYIAIGGSLGKSKEEMHQILDWTVPLIPENLPIHLLGIGVVEDIFAGVERGIDLFDCVSPTRIARNGYVYIRPPTGSKKNKYRYKITATKYKLDKEPIDSSCNCKICKKYTRAYINHLFKADELLGYYMTTYHNVYFLINLMREIREAINENRFQELKEQWGL